MAEAPAIVKSTQQRRLAVFLDGTWNNVGDDTNVWRLKSLSATGGADGAPQRVYYERGVHGLLGGLFGQGLDQEIKNAYQWLVDQYDSGDELFIFGFSRGAYTARSLAGLIAKCGLLMAGGALGVTQLYNRYRRPSAPTLWELIDARDNGTLNDATVEDQWLLKYSMPIHIKFVGVWDTVGALGIPFGNIPGISRSTLGFLSTGLRRPVDNGFHALAVDEHRRAFSPTLWTVRHADNPDPDAPPPRPISSVEQRWFVGAHANVGGGYASDLLPQIPLRWIMKKASLFGLAFRNDVELDGDELHAQVCDSYRQFLGGIYHHVSPPYFRPIGAPPVREQTGTSSTVNETIDGSVFARWNADANYRPPNLLDWANRHNVQLSSQTGSVLADAPATAAPD